jgi:hypothetical protein
MSINTDNENELIRLARELQCNNKAFVKAIIEQRFDEDFYALGPTHFRIKREIKSLLACSPVTQIGDVEARELVLKVSQGFPFEIDKYITRVLEAEQAENRSAAHRSDAPLTLAKLEELDSSELLQLGAEWFDWRLGPDEYARKLYQVGSLLLTCQIPHNLQTYVTELRECYALQQYNAVKALCRTILEATARDICERKGLLSSMVATPCPSCGHREDPFNPKIFYHLLKRVSQGKLRGRASSIYYDACKVIHGERIVNADEALNVLRDTIGVVQELYLSAKL